MKPHIPTAAEQADIKDHFEYDAESGQLVWGPKGRPHSLGYIKKYAGKKAGGKHARGYITTTFRQRQIYVHRIIWFLNHGTWPEIVDHKNQVKTDNRIENLRAVDASQNAFNSKHRVNNTSGVKGVNYYRFNKNRPWRAMIFVRGKFHHLGYFEDFGSAVAARKEAEQKFFAGVLGA